MRWRKSTGSSKTSTYPQNQAVAELSQSSQDTSQNPEEKGTQSSTDSRSHSYPAEKVLKDTPLTHLSHRADDKTAEEYALEGGATLHLVLALRGGSSS